MKVLATVDLPDEVMARFEQRMTVVRGGPEKAEAFQPDAILCSIIPYRFDQQTIANLPASVKAIATYSVGHDHIDLAAARTRGIAVFSTPGVLSDAVAEVAMLLILGAARRATESIALLREGRWTGWTPSQLIGEGLDGKTLGIFGMGNIGRRIARRARAFGMSIAYHDRAPVADEDARYHADPLTLLSESDVILLAWPSTAETRHFIDAERLRLVKSSAIIVNIGRGDLVKDDDLIQALRDGTVLAAGLDVFENEPHLDPGYLDLPNAFLLPHIGSSTWGARLAMADLLVDALETNEAGGIPHNRIA